MLEYTSGELRASPPGEIMPSATHRFYTYDAKYIDCRRRRWRVAFEEAISHMSKVIEMVNKACESSVTAATGNCK
jgi:D-alanine-D-alanine ligase